MKTNDRPERIFHHPLQDLGKLLDAHAELARNIGKAEACGDGETVFDLKMALGANRATTMIWVEFHAAELVTLATADLPMAVSA